MSGWEPNIEGEVSSEIPRGDHLWERSIALGSEQDPPATWSTHTIIQCVLCPARMEFFVPDQEDGCEGENIGHPQFGAVFEQEENPDESFDLRGKRNE